MKTRAISDDEAVRIMRPLAVVYAKRIGRANRSHIPDLIQEGLMGAMEASQTFDMGSGTTFRSYAWWRVRGRMLDYIRVHCDHLTRVDRQRVNAGGEEPYKVVSLEAMTGGDRHGATEGGSYSRGSMRFDPAHHDPEPSDHPAAEFRAWVRETFPGVLHPDQIRLLADYFVRGFLLSAIAERNGICHSRASQMVGAAVTKLAGGGRVCGLDGRKIVTG